jgi:hypothetical protein
MVVVVVGLERVLLDRAHLGKVLTEGLGAVQQKAQLADQETPLLHLLHRETTVVMLIVLQRTPVVAAVEQLVPVQMSQRILAALVDLELPHLFLDHQ